jgi:hypothetical protein
MQYTKYPTDLVETVQMNAGVIVDSFEPSTRTVGNVLGATNSGITFNPNPTYEDFGEDIDNVPPNTWQLKRIKSYDPVLSGSFRTVTAALVAMLAGAGAFLSTDSTHFIPSHKLTSANFRDVWVIGDYSNRNDGQQYAGFLAIHVKHALNVNGFQWKTNKDAKGEFSFEYHGHYDLANPDDPPYEVYICKGSPNALAELTVASTAGTASGATKITVTGYTLASDESYVYKTDTSTAPSVSLGDTLTTGWTALTNGSDITPTGGHTKITVAAVDANSKAVGAGSATITTNTGT